MTESEQICNFNVPVPMEKRTPSACCCTLRTGFIGVHCACAALAEKKTIETVVRTKSATLRVIMTFAPPDRFLCTTAISMNRELLVRHFKRYVRCFRRTWPNHQVERPRLDDGIHI